MEVAKLRTNQRNPSWRRRLSLTLRPSVLVAATGAFGGCRLIGGSQISCWHDARWWLSLGASRS
jgi:hypothetical protein